MSKLTKKVISLVLTLVMALSMSAGIVFAEAGETGSDVKITLVGTDGTEIPITYEDIISAAYVDVSGEDEDVWGYGSNTFSGRFYSLDSILEMKGVDRSGLHAITTKASDGYTNGLDPDLTNRYIYDQDAVMKNGHTASDEEDVESGLFGTALMGTGGAGFDWGKNITVIELTKNHVWGFKKKQCTHECTVSGCTVTEPIVTDEAVAPTCSAPGKTEGSHYETCKTPVVEQEEIPIDPDAHSWGSWKVTKKATLDAKGTYTRVCANDSSHKETKSIAKNNMTAKAKTKTLTAKAKKKTTIKKSKAFVVKNAKGSLSFKKTSGSGKILVDKKGNITVKKGLKKGKTYTIKVKVTSAATKEYKAASKTVTLKIKIK